MEDKKKRNEEIGMQLDLILSGNKARTTAKKTVSQPAVKKRAAAESSSEPVKQPAKKQAEEKMAEKKPAAEPAATKQPVKKSAAEPAATKQPAKKTAAKKPAPKKKQVQKKQINTGKLQNVLKKYGIALFAAILVIVGILVYVIQAGNYKEVFLKNTILNGVDVSGMTADEAKEVLKQEAADYTLWITGKGDITDTITADEIGAKYQDNKAVDEALSEQNRFSWPAMFFTKREIEIPLTLTYDTNLLNNRLATLNCVTNQEIVAPQDAQIVYSQDDKKFVIRKAVSGTAVDTAKLQTAVTETLDKAFPGMNLEQKDCYQKPTILSSNETLKQKCDAINNYQDVSIVYDFGGNQELIDKSVYGSWLTIDDSMNVSVSTDAAMAYLQSMFDRYNSLGGTRYLTTPTGKYTSVTGGTYGWQMTYGYDIDSETANVVNAITTGQPYTESFELSSTAASTSAQDWGTTYAEVDLTEQYMWFIKDGQVMMESDVVTGDPSYYATPEGVYYIRDMQKDTVLTGSPDENGVATYAYPVDYWMMITPIGVGFHDASWQTSFGGDGYLTHGSSGCVNMPTDKAGELYSMISLGTPVVMHY